MLGLAVRIAESYAEAVPVPAIVGQPPTSLEGRGPFQDTVEHQRLRRCRPALALDLEVRRKESGGPHDFLADAAQAIVAATSGRQGPAVLLVAQATSSIRRSEPPQLGLAPPHLAELLPIAAGRHQRCDAAARGHPQRPSLSAPHRPGGAPLRTTPAGGRGVARAVGLPVVTTMSARAGFPERRPAVSRDRRRGRTPVGDAYLREQGGSPSSPRARRSTS